MKLRYNACDVTATRNGQLSDEDKRGQKDPKNVGTANKVDYSKLGTIKWRWSLAKNVWRRSVDGELLLQFGTTVKNRAALLKNISIAEDLHCFE